MSSNTDVKQDGLWETIKVVIQALLIALVVRTLLFQPFNIPSGSLIPTLLVGDYLFVSKYSYGYSQHSFPFSAVPFRGPAMALPRICDHSDAVRRSYSSTSLL